MNDLNVGAQWRHAAGLLASLVLAGCGGGGDDGASATPTKTTQTKSLSGSQGRLDRYLGTWSSGCGLVIFGGGPVKSVQNIWQFTAVSGSKVTGNSEQRQYSDTHCTTPWPIAGVTVKAIASVTVTGQATLTPGTGPVVFAGTADQVQVTLQQAGAAPDTTNQYIAFEGETKLRFTQTLPFSTVDLEYDKR
jgi:hypothetical protein